MNKRKLVIKYFWNEEQEWGCLDRSKTSPKAYEAFIDYLILVNQIDLVSLFKRENKKHMDKLGKFYIMPPFLHINRTLKILIEEYNNIINETRTGSIPK